MILEFFRVGVAAEDVFQCAGDFDFFHGVFYFWHVDFQVCVSYRFGHFDSEWVVVDSDFDSFAGVF